MFKVLLLSLERQLRSRITLGHPIISWGHAQDIARQRRGWDDAPSASKRVSRKSPTICFWRVIQLRAQEEGIAETKRRFRIGVWLGLERRTGQYVVYDKSMGGSGMLEH